MGKHWICPQCLEAIPERLGHSCPMSLKPDQPPLSGGMGNHLGAVSISPSQATKLLCISDLIKSGDIEIRGFEADDAQSAKDVIFDIAQEIALQVHSTP